MKKMVFVLLLVAATVSAFGALHCKYDSAPLFWAGKMRIVEGRQEFLCTCGNSRHLYWLDRADCSE